MRQSGVGTLIIPVVFTLLWLSVFGNRALYLAINGNREAPSNTLTFSGTGPHRL
ncbi:BCCT family transporter [Pectobacterium wasabiae]|uniref:BCCT family transporter n=1 Tax=Pectobacterium wasabiae TaxID=55208 RepID=UPI0002D86D19|nr:BCCT family transporter [Pectobacterium wasabiae]